MRTHTIGEVLNRLKDEFDDITISKIRFLEAEGLITPDRTESGYRKFSDGDVDRLRYVLRAQRDRYLPLKVIKEELERIDAGLPVEAGSPAAPEAEAVALVRGDGVAGTGSPEPQAGAPEDRAPSLVAPLSDVSLTAAELADACGLEPADIRALVEHGLLGDGSTFDGEDLEVARIAAGLLGSGLEPRHLRMYRQFADREVALYGQLVTPLLRQRNPDSRRTATDQVEQLAARGARLHRALVAAQLRALLRS